MPNTKFSVLSYLLDLIKQHTLFENEGEEAEKLGASGVMDTLMG